MVSEYAFCMCGWVISSLNDTTWRLCSSATSFLAANTDLTLLYMCALHKAWKMHSKSLWLNLTCWTRKCVQYSQTANTLALVWWEGHWCQWCAQDNPENGKRKINIISNSTNGKLLSISIHTVNSPADGARELKETYTLAL